MTRFLTYREQRPPLILIFYSHATRFDADDGIQNAAWDFWDRCVFGVDEINRCLDVDAESQLVDAICKTWDILYSRNSETAKHALLQLTLNLLLDISGPGVPPFRIVSKLLPRLLDRGCDPNGFYWCGDTPSMMIFKSRKRWVSWKTALAKCGYRVCNMINGQDALPLVVSTDLLDLQDSGDEEVQINIKTNKRFLENKLPITGLTIREWIEQRFLRRRREILGTATLLPPLAEDLDILQDVDYETVLDCAFDDTYNISYGYPPDYLEELGECWYTVLNGYMDIYREEDGENKSDSEWETTSWETETDRELWSELGES
jgi:hypothetical protein